MDPGWCLGRSLAVMARSLTLKNLPEAGLGTDPLQVEQRLTQIRSLRNRLTPSFDPADIDAFKREGRSC